MNLAKSLWSSVQGDPVFMRKLNGWLTILWFLAALPICLFLSNSVPFLVFVSVYAVVTGHWSTYQASRVEVKQDEASSTHDNIAERVKYDPYTNYLTNILLQNGCTVNEEAMRKLQKEIWQQQLYTAERLAKYVNREFVTKAEINLKFLTDEAAK